jgi:hypothetical protein
MQQLYYFPFLHHTIHCKTYSHVLLISGLCWSYTLCSWKSNTSCFAGDTMFRWKRLCERVSNRSSPQRCEALRDRGRNKWDQKNDYWTWSLQGAMTCYSPWILTGTERLGDDSFVKVIFIYQMRAMNKSCHIRSVCAFLLWQIFEANHSSWKMMMEKKKVQVWDSIIWCQK